MNSRRKPPPCDHTPATPAPADLAALEARVTVLSQDVATIYAAMREVLTALEWATEHMEQECPPRLH